ncbi:MAG: hypothetical protein KC731_02665 [Myxococcales bacterium]|nr:hypothetical protein [Myxococcales bacterium]
MATLSASASLLLACGGSPSSTSLGSGTASGSVDGRPFDGVGASYLIGQPDDVDRTLVIYVFDAPIDCADLASPGWDQVVADATQSLEIKIVGKTPATYPIPQDGTPAEGEADVNYTLTSTAGTPSEISAVSGSVALTDFTADTSAAGSFDLTFPSGSLTGSFDGAWCPDGHEP